MARIDDIERRLQNWARWKFGETGGALGYATVHYGDGTSTAGYREAVIPTVDCEAEETDRAVLSLESQLRATVEMVYLESGGMRKKAERLCCSEATVYSRIDSAHRRIQAWLGDLQRQRKAQRERLEAMQQAARP